MMTGAAPLNYPKEGLSAEDRDQGFTAGVTPGNFGGWIEALDKCGTMTLAQVLAPAINYAKNGVVVNPMLAGVIDAYRPILELFPTTAKIWLKDGKTPEVGSVVYQKDLANTFQRLCDAEKKASGGKKAKRHAGLRAAYDYFYTGPIAKEIADFYKENGGLFTLKDLSNYKPEWVDPVHTNYRGYDVYSTPSTSRGGIELIMSLNLLEGYDIKSLGQNSAAELHLVTEAMKVAKADVYQYVADPKFVDIPMAGLTSKEYAAKRRALIDTGKAGEFGGPGQPKDYQKAQLVNPVQYVKAGDPNYVSSAGCTTEYSIIDRWGNGAGGTVTLGDYWGTKVVIGNTGILLNNGTRDGSVAGKYPNNVNYPQPGKRGLLNNSPNVVTKDGKLVMVYGTPGGETIGITQLQVLLNVVDFGMGMQAAIEAPRIQLGAKPDFYTPGASVTVNAESRIDAKALDALKALGHTVKVTGAFSSSMGGMQGVYIDQTTGWMYGGADPRRNGVAVGY